MAGRFHCPWSIELAHIGSDIHPTAIVDDGARLGVGTKVWHWVHICGGAVIGENCSFGQNVFVGNRVVIGNNVRVQNNVSIYDDVSLEDDVFCGPSMVFTNVINPRAHLPRKNEYKATLVKRGVSIGANATIVCGHTLGEYAFIGAGAVVTSDVPPYALMLGVPARRTGWVCQCGERLTDKEGRCVCVACGTSYEIAGMDCRRR